MVVALSRRANCSLWTFVVRKKKKRNPEKTIRVASLGSTPEDPPLRKVLVETPYRHLHSVEFSPDTTISELHLKLTRDLRMLDCELLSVLSNGQVVVDYFAKSGLRGRRARGRGKGG
jgi:hypothetical protein